MERDKPIIPKLRNGNWRYHLSKNDDGTKNGSVVTEDGYCIAKQPRYADDGEWETHAKSFTAIPDMLKYLIEEWYSLVDKLAENAKLYEKRIYGTEERNRDKERAELYKRFKEVDEILKKAGAFDKDKW